MLFLGDIHGSSLTKIEEYRTEEEYVYCVGDCGIGFPNHTPTFPNKFKFIAGNHDNRVACKSYSEYLGDFGQDPETGIFYISGAQSIDRECRTEGVDWWNWEELSMEECYKCLDLYTQVKPKVIMTHDIPFSYISSLTNCTPIPSRTGQLLDSLFQNWKPDIWIAGHFHRKVNINILGCHFHILNIMELRQINI